MIADMDFFERCSSSYGYGELAGFPKGKPMQNIYMELKELLKEFYLNPHDAFYGFENPENKKHCWIAGTADYERYQLNWDEALIALQAVYADYPLLFFSDAYKTGGSPERGIISPVIDSECARGDFRLFYAERIEKEIAVLAATAKAQDRGQALSIYRAIRNSYRYDHNKGEVTSYIDVPSHSILNCVRNKSAVCQGFARMCQAIMNYISIPAITIDVMTGRNRKHVCNFVFLANEAKWIMVDCVAGMPSKNDSGFDIPPGTYKQVKRADGGQEYYRHLIEFNGIWDQYARGLRNRSRQV